MLLWAHRPDKAAGGSVPGAHLDSPRSPFNQLTTLPCLTLPYSFDRPTSCMSGGIKATQPNNHTTYLTTPTRPNALFTCRQHKRCTD